MEDDEQLFGWDPMPGIVSVWADRDGHALVWQRMAGRVTCTRDRFRPWLLAATLADLAHLGPAGLAAEGTPGTRAAVATYRALDGPPDGYRFLISGRNGRALERALLEGASHRLGRRVASVHDLEDDYHCVGPVEQYLMCTGRVYFRGLAYADLHRMQIDLETTALDPQRGRIFLAAVRDSRGLAVTVEAPTPADEPRLIADLCALVRARDPDVIENHNLFGFDLPFLEQRAAALGMRLALARPGGPARMERYRDPTRGRAGRERMRYSIAGRELIDTLDAVRRHDFVARELPSYRLKDVARHFGAAPAGRTYLPGAQVHATYRRDPGAVRRYALDDVAEVDALSRRLMGEPPVSLPSPPMKVM
jgi:DNA polymerase, archaea type